MVEVKGLGKEEGIGGISSTWYSSTVRWSCSSRVIRFGFVGWGVSLRWGQ